MQRAVIAVALSVVVALLSADVNTLAHAQGDLVAPTNVAAQNTGTAGKVRISWDAVPNAAYYRIGWVAYSDVAPIIASGGDWLEHFAFIDIENRGQTEHLITRLTPGVQYAFIMASNDGRYGTPRWPSSAGWAFLTLNEAPATHASLGSTVVNLTWNAVPGATYYRIGWVVYADVAPIIARGGDWLEHFAFIDIANRGQTAHTITRLTPGLQYAFIVAGNGGRYGTPQWPPAAAWQFLTPSVVQPTGPDSDRAALIALYNATGGANWTDNTNWRSNSPLSEWHGVTTNDAGRVTEVRLGENNLNGRIPAVVGTLTGLIWLDFQGNQLTGSIPTELGNLSNLRVLRLNDNQFSESIPDRLGNLSALAQLEMANNGFTGTIPPSLGSLSNLQTLDLQSNRLNGEIPPWLGNLAKLEWLRLDGNEFTGQIPNGLSRLSNVTFLVLSGNQLTGQIPSWLGNMTSLERLGLSDNRLSGEIPTALGNLPNLRLIRLGGNSLTGCIPDSLQPVADNDFNRLGLPVCQAEPTASTGPSTGEGPYSIVNNDLDYSYTISLTNAWDQEREGVYSRTFPWSQLRVTSQYIETGTNLKNFSETVRSGLRDEWWPNASLFDISSVEEVQLGDVPSYRMRYRVQESPQYCVVDVKEAIVISDALPGYPKGFRVRSLMCESQVRAHGSERGETLDSFRIVTIPSPYYQQFIFTNGVTVKATDGVDPAALRAGADIVVTMLSGRQDLARCMAQRGAALAIIPRDQPVTTLPEYAHLRGTYDFTGRSRDTFDLRGVGAAEPLYPVSSAGEEQLLGQFGPQHPYYSYRGWVAVHEFAHGIQNICFTAADDTRWREFYDAALNANLYPGTHMMADVKEFFAAFSNGYFEVTDELGPDSTRESLKTRFPSVFESLDAIYGGATLPPEYREIIPR